MTRELEVDDDGNEVPGAEPSGVLFVIIDDTFDELSGRCGGPPGPPYGPGVDDLVTYLAGQIDISENKDVILDGYRGAYLEYEQAVRPRYCLPGVWRSANDGHHQVWILDVDGVRLVIDASSPPGASETVRAELRQALESIHFER